MTVGGPDNCSQLVREMGASIGKFVGEEGRGKGGWCA